LIAVLKSFIAALYLEMGSTTMFEFLLLTILDKPEFKDKLENFNINDIPLVPMVDITESSNDSFPSKIESSEIPDKLLVEKPSALGSLSKIIDLDKNKNSETTEGCEILNRLLILEKSLVERSQNLNTTFIDQSQILDKSIKPGGYSLNLEKLLKGLSNNYDSILIKEVQNTNLLLSKEFQNLNLSFAEIQSVNALFLELVSTLRKKPLNVNFLKQTEQECDYKNNFLTYDFETYKD
jgi:hypothetical protein